MYCNCSNNNNYDVIGLCNIKNFSDKYGPFTDKAWVQLSIPSILTVEDINPNIEDIKKVYVNLQITSSKIIPTPISQGSNAEGLILTGKKLLIDGFICEKVVYTALNPCQTVHTISFNIPFCTYIVLEANADIFNDKYCIQTCLEDVFISIMDCKTLFQNITFFIYTFKSPIIPCVKLPCPEPGPNPEPPIFKLPNSIIIKNKDLSETVSTIEFNRATKQFFVTLSAQLPDPKGPISEELYFVLRLKDSTNTKVKITNVIFLDTLTNIFINTLDELMNFPFEYDDILELEYLLPSTITVTDFPSAPTNHTPTENKEYYRIKSTGLEKFTPAPIPTLNKIIFKELNDEQIVTIELQNNKFKVTNTDTEFTSSSGIVFAFLLRDKNGILKESKNIKSNTYTGNFKNLLNNQPYADTDLMDLRYISSSAVSITDTTNASSHTINKHYADFKIESNKLVPYAPYFFKNAIEFRNVNNELMGILRVNFSPLSLDGFSTNVIADTTNPNEEFFNIKIQDSGGAIFNIPQLAPSIKCSDSLDVLYTSLDGLPVKLNWRIILTYKDNNRIKITNFPNRGDISSPPDGTTTSTYRITPRGLVLM
ncbi:DUF3794 domain-containing protein [Clostridium tarantellae]|uniref:DUF3794 domain-containing protein n=1 Tax=Clostridium tarantellae TaxID=39493 RepID=A0A6I1MNY0_9CLOT|nr:DUF3794 domain-containing protein [Clostridium tarantellae]MPQ42611.1 DUF3794 domain-containing protein [Clostridium tarantellae]